MTELFRRGAHRASESAGGPAPESVGYIAAHFPLASVPGAPELRLHKSTPTSGIARLAEMAGADFSAPYWASWWGGGLALARHVLDRPELAAGKRVLDLGAGSGLAAIAAAKAGAASVLAVDVDPFACAMTRLNAAANGVRVDVLHADLTQGPPPDVDIILAGDVFYDAALAQRMTVFLDRCRARNIAVLVGDPGRAFLPHDRLKPIAEYPGPDFGDAPETRGRNAVFAYAPQAPRVRRK